MKLRRTVFFIVIVYVIFPLFAAAQAGRAELFGVIRDSSGGAIPGAGFRPKIRRPWPAIPPLRTSAANIIFWIARRPIRAHGGAAGLSHVSPIRNHLAAGRSDGARCEARGRPAHPIGRSHGRGAPAANRQRRSQPEHGRKEDLHAAAGRAQLHSAGDAPPGRGACPTAGQFLPRINGSRPRTNEYIYDGISVLQPEPGQVVYYPIIDGMAEFKLNVNAYSPEYGRSNGGTVMVIGKSGSNQFHGSLFEFFRNEALNARNLFAQPGPKPEFRRNQYGVTLGGPIQTNKTFFFADWQGTRLRTGITRFSVVPTLAQRQGIFTQAIFDPATPPSTQFPNNTIPANRFDPIGSQILQHYPLPNVAGANNFVRTATEPDNQDQADFRVDRYFGEKHRVFGRYTFFRDDDTPVTPLPDGSGSLTSGVIGHAITRGDAFVGDYNWTLLASALNQFRVGYSRRDLNQSFAAERRHHACPACPQIPSVRCCRSSPSPGFQQIGPTTAANSNFTTSITEFLDTFTLVRGRHTIKFGADIRREALDVLNPPNPTGSFAFTTTGTNSSSVAGSGNALGVAAAGPGERVHHRHSEARDSAARAHCRVLRRRRLESLAAAHAEHRHALHAELPVHGKSRSGRRLQSETQVLDFPAHRPRTGMLRLRSPRWGWPIESATAGWCAPATA